MCAVDKLRGFQSVLERILNISVSYLLLLLLLLLLYMHRLE